MPSLTHESTHPRLHFRLPLDPARLLRARQRIRDYLHEHELESHVVNDVVLAVEEAMTNAVRHSGAADDLELALWFEGADLCAEVRDHGQGFDVLTFDRERLPDPLVPSGRGLYLVAHLMDDLDLTSEGGVTVGMRKRAVLAQSTATQSGLGAAVPGAQVHRDTRQQALLEEIEEAFFALDWEYRYTFVNEAAERMWGMSRQQHLGRTVWEVYPRTPSAVVQALRESMELGSSTIVEAQSGQHATWREYRAYPASFGIIAYVRDIDERKRKELERDQLVQALVASEERGRRELQTTTLLLEAARALASRPSLSSVLGTLSDLVLQVVDHSRVTVSLWDETARDFTVAAAEGENRLALGLRFGLDDLSEPGRLALEAHAGTLVDYDALPPEARGRVAPVPGRLAFLVPLLYRDTLLGLLAVDDPARRHPFSEHEIEIVEGLAAEAAVAIENARLYDAQRRIATTLQENLIHPLPAIRGLELACLSLPAATPELVGGDFRDVFPLDEDRVVVLVGDVMGKGVKAAGLTETVHSAVRALALVTASPAKILRQVNRLLLAENHEQYVSAAAMILDVESGCARMASAGHPPPVLVSCGAAELLEPRYGPPLGTFEWRYENREFRFAPGESLVFYTDGLTEARSNGELFGERRLLWSLQHAPDDAMHPQALIERLRECVLAFAGTLHDDLEILALRLEEASGS